MKRGGFSTGLIPTPVRSAPSNPLITKSIPLDRCPGYLGLLCNQLGDLDGAAQGYRTRIDLAKKLNDLRGEALGGWNLGDVLIKQNECKQGIELLYKYVGYEKSVGDPAWEQDWETARRMEERCRSQEL